jgi:hypothetical protein
MATWEGVVRRASREVQVEASAGELSLTISRTAPSGAIREQRVMVTRYRAWDRDMIEIRSAFGEAGRYAAEGLLAENLGLPLGAIAMHGRYLVVVQKACLEDLTDDGAWFLVARIGDLADALEGRSGADVY